MRALIIALSLILGLPALSFGQCENGQCRVPPRVQVQQWLQPIAEKQPVRTVVRAAVPSVTWQDGRVANRVWPASPAVVQNPVRTSSPVVVQRQVTTYRWVAGRWWVTSQVITRQ